MKCKSAAYMLVISTLVLLLAFSCKKDSETPKEKPTLTIAAATNITSTTASCNGTITSDGGSAVTARGLCWDTNENPTIENSKTTNGTGTGSFTGEITDLTPGESYFVRAYATNEVGTAYSEQESFNTLAYSPTVTTESISSITSTTATGGGSITDDGGSPIIIGGICWSAAHNPTTANSKTTDATGLGNFISSITGLITGTTYYVRAYATNSIGTSYGNEVSFKTTAVPTLTTTDATSITSNSATSGGNITDDGGSAITASGICWSTTASPTTSDSKTTDGATTGAFTSDITNLLANTKYYFRAYATNDVGTAYGNQIEFTTTP